MKIAKMIQSSLAAFAILATSINSSHAGSLQKINLAAG
jgi:hypothetical protein